MWMVCPHEIMVRGLAVGMPRNDLAGRQRKNACLNMLSNYDGLNVLETNLRRERQLEGDR
jgi:hypothetical protein